MNIQSGFDFTKLPVLDRHLEGDDMLIIYGGFIYMDERGILHAIKQMTVAFDNHPPQFEMVDRNVNQVTVKATMKAPRILDIQEAARKLPDSRGEDT